MRYTLVNIFILIVVSLGIISTISMNFHWLLGELLIWTLIYLFLLRDEWKYLYKLFSKGFLLFVFLLIAICIFEIAKNKTDLLPFLRIISIGIITIIFLVPTLTDSFLISTNRIPFIRYFFESFILIRNFIGGLIDDLFLGIVTAPKFKGSGFILKIRFIGLTCFTLIARTPDLITSLLISTKITKFEVNDLKKITILTSRLYLSLIISFSYFLTYIIYHYGK